MSSDFMASLTIFSDFRAQEEVIYHYFHIFPLYLPWSNGALLTMSKLFTLWVTINSGKFLKRQEYQTTLPASWDTCMQVKKHQLELDMEQTDWFNIGKRACQGCMLSPCLLNLHVEYVLWNVGLDEAQLESRLQGEISITSDMHMMPPLWQRANRN